MPSFKVVRPKCSHSANNPGKSLTKRDLELDTSSYPYSGNSFPVLKDRSLQ
jgi:hypothetical protein